jgi:hypothetical protein
VLGFRGVKFDEKGQNILASVIVVQLQNGKTYVPVWPKDQAAVGPVLPHTRRAYFVMPRPLGAGRSRTSRRTIMGRGQPTPASAKSQHLMLSRPRDRRIEQAGDADPAGQSTVDGRLDEAWCQMMIGIRHEIASS